MAEQTIHKRLWSVARAIKTVSMLVASDRTKLDADIEALDSIIERLTTIRGDLVKGGKSVIKSRG